MDYQGSVLARKYCTISIDSAWGVTCDQMDEISADHGRMKGKEVKYGVVMLEKKA